MKNYIILITIILFSSCSMINSLKEKVGEKVIDSLISSDTTTTFDTTFIEIPGDTTSIKKVVSTPLDTVIIDIDSNRSVEVVTRILDTNCIDKVIKEITYITKPSRIATVTKTNTVVLRNKKELERKNLSIEKLNKRLRILTWSLIIAILLIIIIIKTYETLRKKSNRW